MSGDDAKSVETAVDSSLVRDAIEDLPPNMKEVVILHYLMEQPILKVAQVLSLPTGTVKSRLHYACALLQKRLGAKKPLVAVAALALLLVASAATVAIVLSGEAEEARAPSVSIIPGNPSSSSLSSSSSQSNQESNREGESEMNATTAMKAAMAAAAVGVTAVTQGATWTNGNWSVAENWAEGVVPDAGAAVTISPPVAGMTLTIDVDSVSVGSLTFSGNSFTLVGGAIAAAGNLTVDVVATCDCDLSFTGKRTLYLNKNCTFNGSVTGSESLTVGGSNTATSSAGASSIVFNGQVTASTSIRFEGGGWYGPENVYFYGKVTASSIGYTIYQLTRAWLYAAGNEIGTVYEQNDRTSVYPMCADALTDRTVVNMPDTSYGIKPHLNLRNFSQTIDRITTGGLKRSLSGQSASAMTYSLRSYGPEDSDAKPTTLTLNATASNQNNVRVYDKITLVYNPAGDYTQTFATNFAHATSGEIVVSNGTFRVDGTSSFANVGRIVVADGATFALLTEAANALAGVTNIALGANSHFAITNAATPFAANAVALEMDETSTFDLPHDANYLFKSVRVGEAHLDGGAYTGGEGTPFSGTGSVTVPDMERETVEATWTGAGDSEGIAVHENWEGGETPALKSGSLLPLFASGGTQALVDRPLDFKGLSFGGAAASFAVVSNVPSASLTIRQSGVAVAASHSATVDVPVTIKSDQSWSIASGSTLRFKSPVGMSTPYPVSVSGSGETSGSDGSERPTSTLRLDAPNGFLGTFDASGSQVLVHSPTNAFGPSSDIAVTLANSRLALYGGTIERPIVLSGANNKYYWFHSYGGEGVTNRITKALTQSSGTYWRPYVERDSVLVTEGGVTMQCDCILAGGGEWIIRGAPLKISVTSSSASAFELTGGETIRFQVGGNVTRRLKMASSCDVHCEADNTFSGTTSLFCSKAGATLHLHGHEVAVTEFGALSGGTIASDEPGVLKLGAQNSVVTNSAVGFVGAAGFEMCGSGAVVFNRAIDSAGELRVTKGKLGFTENGSWRSCTNVTVSGTGRFAVAKARTISTAAKMAISGSGVVEIPSGVVLRVASLTVGGEPVASGTYGSADSAASKTYQSHFAGAGALAVGRSGFILTVE